MGNINENRINVQLPETDLTVMKQSLATFISKLPQNTSLTKDERSKLSAISVDNKVFAEDALRIAKTLPEVMPPYINLAFMENDVAVFTQLDAIELLLQQALEELQDAKRIAGHEAYIAANLIYNFVKNASQVGIPGTKSAYDILKVRYQNHNPGKKVDENP